jgi:hypothetical protein
VALVLADAVTAALFVRLSTQALGLALAWIGYSEPLHAKLRAEEARLLNACEALAGVTPVAKPRPRRQPQSRRVVGGADADLGLGLRDAGADRAVGDRAALLYEREAAPTLGARIALRRKGEGRPQVARDQTHDAHLRGRSGRVLARPFAHSRSVRVT